MSNKKRAKVAKVAKKTKPAVEVTEEQLEMMRVWRDLESELGRSPTQREVQQRLGLASHTAVDAMIRRLIPKGLFSAPVPLKLTKRGIEALDKRR